MASKEKSLPPHEIGRMLLALFAIAWVTKKLKVTTIIRSSESDWDDMVDVVPLLDRDATHSASPFLRQEYIFYIVSGKNSSRSLLSCPSIVFPSARSLGVLFSVGCHIQSVEFINALAILFSIYSAVLSLFQKSSLSFSYYRVSISFVMRRFIFLKIIASFRGEAIEPFARSQQSCLSSFVGLSVFLGRLSLSFVIFRALFGRPTGSFFCYPASSPFSFGRNLVARVIVGYIDISHREVPSHVVSGGGLRAREFVSANYSCLRWGGN